MKLSLFFIPLVDRGSWPFTASQTDASHFKASVKAYRNRVCIASSRERYCDLAVDPKKVMVPWINPAGEKAQLACSFRPYSPRHESSPPPQPRAISSNERANAIALALAYASQSRRFGTKSHTSALARTTAGTAHTLDTTQRTWARTYGLRRRAVARQTPMGYRGSTASVRCTGFARREIDTARVLEATVPGDVRSSMSSRGRQEVGD